LLGARYWPIVSISTAVLPQVAHHLENLVICLAEPDHEAALGGHAGREFLEALQEVQRIRIVGARPRLLVEPRRGLEVVVHDIRRRGLQDLERAVHPAAEVRREDLDASLPGALAGTADAFDEMAAPPSRRSSRSTLVMTTYFSFKRGESCAPGSPAR
jgi:hypothetical protein